MEVADPRQRRPHATGFNHSVDDITVSEKYSLDRAVTAVANPAVKTQPICFQGCPGAVPNALNIPLYPDQNGFGHALIKFLNHLINGKAVSGHDMNFLDRCMPFSPQYIFHFHCFDDQERLTLLDLVSLGYFDHNH